MCGTRDVSKIAQSTFFPCSSVNIRSLSFLSAYVTCYVKLPQQLSNPDFSSVSANRRATRPPGSGRPPSPCRASDHGSPPTSIRPPGRGMVGLPGCATLPTTTTHRLPRIVVTLLRSYPTDYYIQIFINIVK